MKNKIEKNGVEIICGLSNVYILDWINIFLSQEYHIMLYIECIFDISFLKLIRLYQIS